MCRLSLAFGLLTSTDFYPKRKNATFFESEVSVMERINEWVTEKNIEPDTIRIETVIVPEYFKNDSKTQMPNCVLADSSGSLGGSASW